MTTTRPRTPIIYTYLFATIVLSISPAITFFILHSYAFLHPRLSLERQIDLDMFVKDRVHFNLYISLLHGVLNWLLILLFASLACRPIRSSLNLRPLRTSWISLAVYTIGVLAMGKLLIHVMYLLHLRSYTLESIQSLLTTASLRAPILGFTLFCIVGPITEEFLFRGYIQPRLVQRHGPFLGILITALLFGIYHHDLVQGIYAAAFGLFVGAVSYRASSILPAIIIHIVNNSLSTLQTYYPQHAVPVSIPLLIGIAIILPASVWLLCNNPQNPPLFPSAQQA